MSTIPQDPDERIEWIITRAQMLDQIRETNWIADEIEKLWNNPDDFEDGGLFEQPDEATHSEYVLFRLGVLFGTDYEHYYPREEDWRD